MSWDTIKTQLESLKTTLASQTTAATAETAESAKAADVAAVKLACETLIGQAQDLQRMVEEKREPTALEVLDRKLAEILAEKDHTETRKRDKDGYLIEIRHESMRLNRAIVQEWMWKTEDGRHLPQGTRLVEVAVLTGDGE